LAAEATSGSKPKLTKKQLKARKEANETDLRM
jgi:hypothetical protein